MMGMKTLNILLVIMLLSIIITPMAVNFMVNVVLPVIQEVGHFVMNLKGSIGVLGGGGGDEIDPEPHPT